MDCLAGTGSTLPIAAAVIAVAFLLSGAVAVAWSIRRRSGGATIAVLALLLMGGFAGGLADASPASAADCPAPTPPIVTIAGVWHGSVVFPSSDPPVTYTLQATVVDDGTTASATVDYPGLCSSVWTQTSRAGDTVTFLETITPPVDPSICSDLGVVTLTRTGDPLGSTLAWTYVYSTGPGPFDQATTLTPGPLPTP